MKYFTTLAFVFLVISACAQKQNNTWCFGDTAGIDFNSGSPVPFSTAMFSYQSCASVSDRNTGALLFYTDGVKVWNRTSNIMPNGNGIGNDFLSSTLQGVAIVPFTNDSNKYYLFCLEPESLSDGALFYSVVDMTLDGGMGNVVSSKKKIKLGQGFVEGMYAVATCDGHWLILSTRATNEFYAYKISASGLDTNAVVSKMPFPYVSTLVLAPIKTSPDNKKLVFATYKSRPATGQNVAILTINDFDEKTGKISNGQHLLDPSPSANYYSAEFSGDGSKLYVTDLSLGLFQLDLSLPTPAAIKASKTIVYATNPSRRVYSLQIAPDGNIYVSIEGGNVIDRISNANAATPNWMYTTGAVVLSPGALSTQSLPPAVYFAGPRSLDTTYSSTNIDICRGGNARLKGLAGAISYTWHDGDSLMERTVNQEGTYWVRSQFTCGEQVDTFNVAVTELSVDIGKDTTICTGHPMIVRAAADSDSATYTWQNGSTADSFVISRGGTYWVTVDLGPCIVYDTINVAENDSAYFQLPADTILCANATYDLYIPEWADIFRWSTGARDSMITVKKEGDYFLEVTRGGCTYTDTITVQYAESSLNIGNDTLVCNTEQLTLSGKSILNSSYLWNTGERTDSIIVTGPGLYALAMENVCGIFTDSIQVDYKVCDCKPFVPNAFTPNNDGRNDKLGPLMKCKVEKYEFIIVNRFGEAVFRSTDMLQKWDGTYKGQPCDVGAYYYLLKIKNISGTDELKKGDVILIR